MRQLLITLMLFAVMFISSCAPCAMIDCASNNVNGQFRIVRAADGTDLVFGRNTLYDKNKIKFFTINGVDTTFFDYAPTLFADIGYDSILYVTFPTKPSIVYMKLNDLDIDTFKISYTEYHSKCCGTITTIDNFRFNNLVDIPGSKGTQAIRK